MRQTPTNLNKIIFLGRRGLPFLLSANCMHDKIRKKNKVDYSFVRAKTLWPRQERKVVVSACNALLISVSRKL